MRTKSKVHVAKRLTELSKGQKQTLALISDEIFMQPWFVPKPIYLAMRRMLPNIHLMKMRHYFDDYGCLRCGSENVLYGACGLCQACNILVRSRIMTCLKNRLKKAKVRWDEIPSDHYFDRMNLAQLILKGPVQKTSKSAS